jgi:hypothetical protein
MAFISIIPCAVVAYAFLNGRGIREVFSTCRHAPP